MTFLRANNLDVSALIEGFNLDDTSIEPFDRALNDSLEGVTYGVKKRISFSTDYMTGTDAASLEGWLRGRGHFWAFERGDGATTRFSLYSNEGGMLFATSTATQSTATPKYGTWGLQVNSGGTATATATFGTEGNYTVSVWHRIVSATSGAWALYTVRRRDGTTDFWASTATQAAVNVVTVSAASGFLAVTLNGKDSAGTSATSHFDQVMVAPYAMTDAMIAARSTATIAEPQLPFINISGDALPLPIAALVGKPGPIVCKAFVDTLEYQPLVVDGVFRYTARSLKVKLEQR